MNAPSILLSRRLASSSICLSCRRSLLRQFSASARKPAAAPFQSYPLNPRATTPINPPPSPRDTAQGKGVDGTIAQPPPLPTVHETRPPRERDGTPTEKRAGKAEASASEVKETEAPKAASSRTPPTQTQSTAPAPSTPPSTTAAPAATPAKPRSRLRTPRKAAMKLTPAAVAHLRALLDQPDPKLIKVGVRNRGCSGLAYHLEFVERAGAFDETVEQDGVRVLIDSKALFSIIGSEMDWVEDKLSQRFVFRNPNIKEQCGCGESFMV